MSDVRASSKLIPITRRRLLTGLFISAGIAMTMPLVANAQSSESIQIYRHTREGPGSVNSYIVEAQNGVVLIDAQRVLSEAQVVADKIKTIGKPLQAVLVTHPHPDHFGGLAAIIEQFPDVPVYSSAATAEEMATDSHGFMAATKEAFPDDTPEEYALPTHTFADGDRLTFGDISLVVDEIGPGESETMSMFYSPDSNSLFTGDLVAYAMTPFVLENRLEAWQEQLAAVKAEYGAASPRIMPGHGVPGEFSTLLDWQSDYLGTTASLVSQAKEDGSVEDTEIADIIRGIQEAYPDHQPVAGIPNLLELNIRTLADD